MVFPWILGTFPLELCIGWPARSELHKWFSDEHATNIEEYLGGLYNYIIYNQLPESILLFSSKMQNPRHLHKVSWLHLALYKQLFEEWSGHKWHKPSALCSTNLNLVHFQAAHLSI